jgi:hypothetical protein
MRTRVYALWVLVPVLAFGSEDPSPPRERTETRAPGATWSTVYHGYAFLTSNRQGGPSGEQDFDSVNHLMIVTSRRWGPGTFDLLGTFSAEPMTIAPAGAPLLFQRGETYRDVLLVDRQHAHDLFVRLGARLTVELVPARSVRIGVAPVGEPTVGPTPFVHRLSASENPLAPLAHHNQDSTHISADVLTAGVQLGRLGLEASAFHGREPDENRWDVDQGGLDSYAARLSWRPAPGLYLQVSAARRERPEAVEDGDQTRQTASVEFERSHEGGFAAATLVAGRNLLEDGAQEWGSLLEGIWKLGGKHFIYGRAERVDRDLFELQNKAQRPSTVPARRVAVEALTVGYTRELPSFPAADAGLGAALTVYRFEDRLEPVYGERPVSAQIFLRLRFGSKQAGAHHHHGALARPLDQGADGTS